MALTREQTQSRLDAYLSAELRILQSQEYQIGDGSTARSKKLAELDVVRRQIDVLSGQLAALDAAASGAGRIVYARPAN